MNYWKIDTEDVCNGDGLRVVLWLSGCSHRCRGCQNPQTWDANSGIPFDEKAKEELFRELDKDYISGLTLSGGDPLNEANLDGVLDIVTEFNKRYKKTQDMVRKDDNNHNMLNRNAHEIRLSLPNKNIWLYTGFDFDFIKHNFEESKKMLQAVWKESAIKRWEIIENIDVLIDGKYIDSQRNSSKKWAGSDNQRVIDIQKSLEQNKVVLYCD